ncbi:tRNA (adenine(22)-N(1))-methyltransferase [Lutispora saccharofermentans]|uniref:Class I SAM-dependent methyltransferase n=1 Tax=Lutispora saccharofermentans TaxID=3024236 RepID=A0ABT1NHQ5_9FIRM|nr:class I SAM-dependent methyltransferase [Lutispora saccharofermentans]MCQ1530820.1 class I SAM-dependent methyltransferase [Lutispora saccharofermentans]
MDLTPRLAVIGESIDECDVVADIGSDHAYLPIYLINNNKAKKAIATDINKGPAEISMKRVKKYGLEQHIEIRIGDGLSALKDKEADIIVIAGMGGILIQNILSEGIDIARSAGELILQPMRDSRILIKWLIQNSFEIFNGEIVKENDKFYEIIWTRYKQNCYDEKSIDMINEMFYYKNSPALLEYIDKKISEYSGIIDHLENFTHKNQKRIEECSKELIHYKEAKKWLSLNVEQ